MANLCASFGDMEVGRLTGYTQLFSNLVHSLVGSGL